jgi:hypothetical protein
MNELPTFDEWYADKNCGYTFEHAHMQPGMRYDDAWKAMMRLSREYLTDMVQELGNGGGLK